MGSVCCQGGAVTEKLLPWPGLELGTSHNHWILILCFSSRPPAPPNVSLGDIAWGWASSHPWTGLLGEAPQVVSRMASPPGSFQHHLLEPGSKLVPQTCAYDAHLPCWKLYSRCHPCVSPLLPACRSPGHVATDVSENTGWSPGHFLLCNSASPMLQETVNNNLVAMQSYCCVRKLM